MTKNPTPLQNSSIHHIPFHIEYEGPANVRSYFKPSQSDSEDDFHASFRGRALCGTKVVLPEGYKGVLVRIAQEEQKSDPNDLSQLGLEEASTSQFKPTKLNAQLISNLDSWVEWGHDIVPTTHDKAISSLGWLKVASIIHSSG